MKDSTRKELRWHVRNVLNVIGFGAGGRMIRPDGSQSFGGYEGLAESREREKREDYYEQHRHLF